jgi:3-oxoacyl-(acyl-carrier-protein) synthase/3-hydroxymyristoyl/3-hydroxydecanoyl-(acyl carrier protein) dehydratase/1-acyl-sn-glycerol-3-phosphate acyltransferase
VSADLWRDSAVAVVGWGCVLPGALTPEDLWTLVRDGRCAIGSAAPRHWSVDPRHVMGNGPDDSVDKTWSDRGGYVTGFERVFDPKGFLLPADDLAGLEPGFAWALHAARESLRSAGYGSGQRPLPRAGVILGNLSYPTPALARFAASVWWPAAERGGTLAPEVDPRQRFMSGRPAHLLARALGLGAGGYALDAACASSLYAIEQACAWLRSHRADVMLAGGVNHADDLFLHIGFCALRALSPTGQSRPFHRDADGLVPAEGAALVALKRLEDAVAAGDRILGVIRAVGLSNDGRGGGLLAPSEEGQERAVRAAYGNARLAPSDVTYVECHATGTPVGDAVELRTLERVFGSASGLALGSLKANLGHLITASGAAALIKTLCALRAGEIPPALHADAAQPALGAAGFRLPSVPEPWPSSRPRRAAISNFGFGGNNAHLIVEAWEPSHARTRAASRPETQDNEPVAIVGLSARVGDATDLASVARALFAGTSLARRRNDGCREARAETIALDLARVRFPPHDLERTLAQQLFMLAAALELQDVIAPLTIERTAVIVGMQCDAEIARSGLRWRLPEIGVAGVGQSEWLAAARAAVVEPLSSARVLGSMPNIVANRVSSQFDLRGPSFTVSAEEASGNVAVDLALHALQRGEIDAALVGAVDLCCEPVHAEAARRVLPPLQHFPADAAVLMVLKRLSDARRAGDHVLAVIPGTTPKSADLHLGVGDADGRELTDVLGHSHAASGLLHVVAAILALHQRVRPSADARAAAWTADHALRSVRVRVHALGGGDAETWVAADPETVAGPPSALPLLRQPDPKTTRIFQAHLPAIVIPPVPGAASVPDPDAEVTAEGAQRMPRAPRLPPALDIAAGGLHPESHASNTATSTAPAASHLELLFPGRVAQIHESFMRSRAEAQRRFVASSRRALELLASARGGTLALVEQPAVPPSPAAAREPDRSVVWTRDQLRVHAGGKISDVFGPGFAAQDDFVVQVRMPEEPLLLVDRVTQLDAEASVLGRGTIVTETDVHARSWYLHEGRMPAGILVESGQADLLLISWMGIDAHNRGQRRYRLLGCDLSFHGALPAAGETLRYEIHIDSHAQLEGVRLFFFHYDCYVGDALRLRVRNGRAGFFTERELDESRGVLWDPTTAVPAADAQLDAPRVTLARRSLGRRELEAFAAGDTHAAFGTGFEAARTHVRSPRIPADRLLLLDEIVVIDTAGGPWRRGYVSARLEIKPEHWFFAGHFKNDPCMPGTLMFEGALQAMSVYLAALGYTLERDGWRFEPVPDETFSLRCQGQVVPTSRELICEIFVEEVVEGPRPTLYADLLGTVDGRKAFHCRRMGLRLVPDYPLDERAGAHLRESSGDQPVATVGDMTFGYDSLLACAWGQPSRAFGEMYREFDDGRRVPRLPGPPYHFMTRVTQVEGLMGGGQRATATLEYDVPPDAWYFGDGGSSSMPYAVLLEAALQPCGWLASYAGCATGASEELFFRNLDGTGTLYEEITPDAGTLRTVATLLTVSRSASIVIVAFQVDVFVGDRRVHELKTRFGFFPAAALAGESGLEDEPEVRAWALEDPRRPPDPLPTGGAVSSSGRLAPFDAVVGYWPDAGAAGLGRACAEKLVDPGQWPFRAHFFQDPVQPGSLGLHALLELLRFTMSARGLGRDCARPRFEPIAVGRPMTWKFRGQVLPAHRLVTTAIELREIGRDARGEYAVADGHLFVDGRRIYHAEGLAMRIVEDTRTPRVTLSDVARREPEGLDLPALRNYWCGLVGLSPGWLGDDLFAALLRRYVRSLVVAAPTAHAALAGRSVLYLANHQTQIESWLATIALSYHGGAPVVTVANAKHRARWVGWLRDSLFAHPGARDPDNIAYFDKGRPESLPEVLRTLAEDVRRRGSSILVHAEGTRQRSARQPMRQVSSLLIDLALELDLPIVPVRFRGGLPVDNVSDKLEFPFGHAAQEYALGAPILPSALRDVSYGERRTRVLDAIDVLEPDLARAAPNPPDAEFARRVVERQVQTGAGEVEATLMCVLAEAPAPGADTRALVEADRLLTLPDDAHGRWLAPIARRLFGPRGPRVVLER